MRKMKKLIAIALVATLVLQCLSRGEQVKAASTECSEVVYSDGIKFEITENEEGIYLTGKYDGQNIKIVQGSGDDETAEATICTGLFSKTDYTLEITGDDIDIDDIDIDALYDCETVEETIENINCQDLLENSEVNVYDDDENLVDVIELDAYEGQACIAAGTASYYLLSAAVSILITHKAITIYQSATKKAEGKKRGKGLEIDKNKIPKKRKKNKTIKGSKMPKEGEPNSSIDLIKSATGKLSQRRFFDENGEPCLDVDFSHGGNHKFPHIHFWN